MSPLANMISQIKNAQAVKHEQVLVPFSKLKYAVALIMMEKGFLNSVDKKKKKLKKSEVDYIEIGLKYDHGTGVIHDIDLISKPSRRMYQNKRALRPFKGGFGFSVLSTSKGIMTGEAARQGGLGGELLCTIW